MKTTVTTAQQRPQDNRFAVRLAILGAIAWFLLTGCGAHGSSDLSSVIIDALFKNVFGGLAIFLFGMDVMTDALRSVAGASLRKFIDKIAGNRFTAVAVGTVVTGVIQSSSAFSLMVLAMVEANLIRMSQALPMLFGANIGTTFTGWLFAWKVTKYGLTMIGAGYFGSLVMQKVGKLANAEQVSRFLLGLGMVFVGLTVMSEGFKDPVVTDALRSFFSTMTGTGHLAMAKCILAAAIATAVVQSSSATLGIVIALANLGVITFETAVGLILGLNIGTTVTAGLALLRGKTTVDSKRVAMSHFLFNVIGALMVWTVGSTFVAAVEWMSATLSIVDVAKKAAVAHTSFNLLFSVLFTLGLGGFQKLVSRIVPEQAEDPEDYLSVLKPRLIQQEPEIAIEASRKVLIGMSATLAQMFELLEETIGSGTDHRRRLGELEKKLDRVQKSMGKWFTRLRTKHFGIQVSKELNRQQRITSELESVGDSIDYIVLKLHELRREKGFVVEGEIRAHFLEVHEQVIQYLGRYVAAIERSEEVGWKDARLERRRILTFIEDRRDDSIELVQKRGIQLRDQEPHGPTAEESETIDAEIVADIYDVFRSYRDMVMAGENVAKALVGKKY